MAHVFFYFYRWFVVMKFTMSIFHKSYIDEIFSVLCRKRHFKRISRSEIDSTDRRTKLDIKWIESNKL